MLLTNKISNKTFKSHQSDDITPCFVKRFNDIEIFPQSQQYITTLRVPR